MRLVFALVLCPPLGIFALALLLLAIRARLRIGAVELEMANERMNRSQMMMEIADAVMLFGIIFGVLCYATAGIVFGLISATKGLG